jgi:hypothetical protein
MGKQNQMSDPSIDPTLARPIQTSIQNDTNLQQTPVHGVLSSDIFSTTYEGGPDPATYQLAAAAWQGGTSASVIPTDIEDDGTTHAGGKRGSKSKKSGPLIRKRSGWNAFYKEQFAIYHANNPPKSKQNARERTGFSSYAAQMWKQLSPAQKEAYVQRAGEDDALAVSRPVEKLRRKRAGLLETLGRIVAELETDFGVESLVFWSEREIPTIQPDGSTPTVNEGEAYGIVGSSTGSRFIELLTNSRLGPHEFQTFIQQNQPQDVNDAHQNLLVGAKKRKTINELGGDLSDLTADDLDPTSQLKKKAKSNISRDYHDAEFRRLLLTLLNSTLPSQSQKTRLPRGFFGSYLEKHGLELIGLPERPIEVGEGGKIGGWSADALRRNLEAIKADNVFIRRIAPVKDGLDIVGEFSIEESELQGTPDETAGVQEEEAARILAEGAGGNRSRRRTGAK